MPRSTFPTADASPAVAFEVERFGWTANDRLEVVGRWFGLRGHRFMRPALIVEAGDDRRRLLALLDHKPWAADDGEPWIAAFSWAGDPVALTFAELSVAPSVSLELPPPAAPGSRATGARRRAQGPRAGPRVTARRADPPDRELEQERAEAAALRTELAAARARLEALEAQPPPAEPPDAATAAERDALAADLRKARTRADDLRRERDEARAAAAASPAEADAEAVRAERDAALAERDAAREEAGRQRRALERRIESAERRLAEAIAERDGLARERDATRAERDDALARADAATAARDRARDERAAAVRARDEAVEAREAAQAVAQASAFDRAVGAPRSRTGPAGPRPSPAALWGPRVMALAVLLLLVLVVWSTVRGAL